MRHLGIRRTFIALLVLASSGLAAANVLDSYGKVALPFEPNLGQTDARVQFLARGPGIQLFLTSTEAVFRLDREDRSSVVRMALAGARRHTRMRGLERLPGESHYLAGAAGARPVTHVPHYGRVKAERVYRGIDLAYYGNGAQLEYDFIVAPGADPRAIAIEVQGARGLEIGAEGKLLIHTDAGSLVWKAPVAYQERDGERLRLASSYALRAKNRVGFRVAQHDRRLPLVIDPVLEYATLLGGTGHDRAHGIAVDASQNAVVTGVAGAVDFPTTAGAHDRTTGGIFVTKLNAAGSALVYSTFLGPGRGTGVALQGGHAYVTGWTTSTTLATAGAYNNLQAGNNAFVAKLKADGSGLEFVAILGPVFEGPRIAVDAAGNSYVTGSTTSNLFPTTAGAYQDTRPTATQVYQGDIDAFFLKLNAAGSALLYSSFLASTENDIAHAIAVDATGRAYITGTTQGRTAPAGGFPAAMSPFPTTASAYQQTFSGLASGFVAKFDPSASGAASLVYSTFLSGDQQDLTRGIAVDASGNAYVTGRGGALFPTTSGAYGATGGQGGAFVTKLNAGGSALVYSAMIAGAEGQKIALDSAGNALVVGFVTSPWTFVPLNGIAGINGGSLFLARIDSSGAAAHYSAYIDGHLDNSLDVAVDPFDSVYVAGTAHQYFNATPGAYQNAFASTSTEAFVSKIVTNRAPIADAGSPQTGYAGSFTLNGSASSDPDNDPLTYEWRNAAGQVVGITANVTVSLSQGVHDFTLTVSDGKRTDSDDVTITVQAAITMNFRGSSTGRVMSNDGKVDCETFQFCPLAIYTAPTAVTLTATPHTGAYFYGWTDACAGTGACTITVTSNVVVGARFDIQQHTLTVTSGIGGKVTSTSTSGIDCGTSCSVTRDYNTDVELKAQPEAGYLFDAWSGACSGTTVTCTVKLNANKSAAASFKAIAVTQVTLAPTSASLAVGGQRRLTATASFSDGTARPLTERSIEASDNDTCAITRSGVVQCIGRTPAPAPVPAFEKAIALAGGTSHICALFTNGTVNCEGTVVPVSGAVAIAAQSLITCALLSNGTVECWNGMSTAPVPVPVPGITNAVAIGAEAGTGFCAVLSDGSVSCWSGYGDGAGSTPAVAPVPGVLNAVAVTYGVQHGCALISNGGVMCWGDNDHGQLGNGQILPLGSTPTPATWVRDFAGVLTGAIDIVAGDYHSCALLADGTAKCWGVSLGTGTTSDSPLAVPFFKAIPPGLSAIPLAVNVAAGAYNTCVTIAGGSVWCQGYGAGINSINNPTRVAGFDPVLGLSWTSANAAVARITASGVAVGAGMGTTTATATEGSSSASSNLTVTPAASMTARAVTADPQLPPVIVTFSGVSQAGTTTLSAASCTPPPPAGFKVGNPPQCFGLTSSTAFMPPALVCFTYDPAAFTGTPDLFHYESLAWKKITKTTVNNTVCGEVDSFSPFALFEPGTTAPVILAASANPSVLWPPNHKMTPVTVSVTLSDGLDPASRCRIESVASNEPVEGLGDGDAAPDWRVTGALTLDLRAERSALGTGRVYAIGLRCTDDSGNSAARAVHVTVPIRH